MVVVAQKMEVQKTIWRNKTITGTFIHIKHKLMKRIFVILLSLIVFSTSFAQTALQEGLALKYLVQLPTEKSAHPPVLILLHGYGSDERDLFELRTFLPNNYLIIAARAPYELSGGGYQWYEMTNINGVHDGKQAELANSRKLIKEFIAQVIAKYSADPKRVYLSGFSQGAIMSYQVGLTNPSLLRGIGVLSGTIYPSLKPMVKKSDALRKLKVFVAHGSKDERISYADGKAACNYVKTQGMNPEFHTYAKIGHSITIDVIEDFAKWLKK